VTSEEAGAVLAALRIAKGLLHEDDKREPQRGWYVEVCEAIAIQESFLAEVQRGNATKAA
jgi:hypothetical protein